MHAHLPRTRIALAATIAALGLGTVVIAAPGTTTLPTQWKIRGSETPVATVGNLPSGLALSRDGSRIVTVDAGYGTKDVRVLDTATWHLEQQITLKGAFGAPLRDADGDGVWVSVPGSFQETIAHIDTTRGVVDRDVALPLPFYPVAIARAPGGMLAVAGDLGNRVAFVDPNAEGVSATVDVGEHPAALQFSADGSTLYVADRAESDLDVIDVRTRRVRSRIRVGLHPVALASDGKRLFVADSDDDDVAVVDLAEGRTVQRARVPFARDGVVGTSPNALTLAGDRLYVTCGAANALAVFRVGPNGLTSLGALPTGWYPTAVAVDRAHGLLYVADGMGESSHPNPTYNYLNEHDRRAYIGTQLVGSIRRVAIPTDAQLAQGLGDVRELAEHDPVPPSAVVRPNGPIKHVIYVIKENRSYDQVLGDEKAADGDPSLVLFGRNVTPNEHAIAERFGIFDRFFVDGHVSADGHNWTDAAIANDYLEKMWPQQYSGHRPFYDFQDGAKAARPHDGYLWTDAVRHGVSLRDYGEYTTAGPGAPVPVAVASDILRPRTDRMFASFDLDYPEVDRYAEWKREFDRYEQTRTLPQLEIVWFGRDHTAGTSPGHVTPQGMVADNDLAVGKLIDAVSHSADWGSTAIFVLEDDAQSGPDHVDEQRSPLLVASPYAAGGVQHAHYSTASVLRTIEILLGLPPMTPYDAGAAPLSAAFRSTPDPRPFDALGETVDMRATNSPMAYRAADSAKMDFADADDVDDGSLNDILWHAVKGPQATPPPYGAFDRNPVRKHAQGSAVKDDDD
ncbi:MAG TPA: bifunctional YncE family protein/alkaline phosphatase family protein [Candidatus Limnocylindria bacterium]|nr:bifunctional YncE family protein/alkaline phosphatase family protein [Candidatus Limnocylindria bacterium]